MKTIFPILFSLLLITACSTTGGPAIVSNEKKAHSHYQLGISAFNKGDLIKAKRQLNIAIGYAPDIPYYYNHLGLVYLKENNFSKAEFYFKKSYSLDKLYTDPLNNLGVAYIEQGKLDLARKQFRKVLQDSIYQFPHHALTNLGVIDRMEKNYSSAEKNFKKAIQLKGNYCESYKELGILYDEQNLHMKSAEQYKKTLKFCPYHIEALYRGAVKMMILRKEKTAQRYLQKCIRIDKDNVNAVKIPFLEDCLDLAKKLGITNASSNANNKKEIQE